MLKSLLIILIILFGTPALAQPEASPGPTDGCKASSGAFQAAGMAGAYMGGLAEKGFGKKKGFALPTGVGSTLGVFVAGRIACMLDSQERLQSEQATMQAVDQGVGGQSSWQSATHKGVQGSSSVVAETHETDGSLCRNVSDVIVVNGEESTVNKRLCRASGSTSFILAA